MFEFLPFFERTLLARLRLNATDAARVCGITPRQLTYWAQKGSIPTAGDCERCYDIVSMEKAVQVRRALDRGYTLETASNLVNDQLAEEIAVQQRFETLSDEELLNLVTEYVEQLEARLVGISEEFLTYFSLSTLGEAAQPLEARVVEQFFQENPYSFDTAMNIAIRLGYVVEEVEKILEDLTAANVLTKSEGGVPVYRLRRRLDAVS